MATIMGCKAARAKRIIAIDINPTKFDAARKFGATVCVNPNDHRKPIEEVIADMTGGGCEFTFECVGNVETMNSAFNSLRTGPSVSTVVGMVPVDQKVSVSPVPLLFGRVWKGSFFGGIKGKEGVPRMVDMYMKKQI
ncbi:zinc-binding dehydrogenase, partial [Klebsiella pneumoniae]|uniref:zinc-binding dehydrogenase n=1 Tax=Klebsiella pneumoniae TaxID=573 RepID=UPI0027D1FF04